MRVLLGILISLSFIGVSAQDAGAGGAGRHEVRSPSVQNGIDTSSSIQPGFYFDPYSAYTTAVAQAAGEAPPGWTKTFGWTNRQLYMTVRPCKPSHWHSCP
jgi:hypothetical protein